MRSLISLLEDLRLKPARTRLVEWLLEHCPERESKNPQTIALSMSKGLLASELGISSETLSRMFADLEDRHVLEVHGRVLTLTCPSNLEHIALADGERTIEFPRENLEKAESRATLATR